MKDNNFIILICGASGSGKSSVADKLHDLYGWKSIDSYTTRPKRSENEGTHIFVSDDEFNKINPASMVAYTEFSGYRYCATTDQVEEAQMYVIDPFGIKTFFERYRGNKNVLIVYLSCRERTRFNRMLKRGDTVEAAIRRIDYDRNAFKNIYESEHRIHPIHVDEKTIDQVADEIFDIYNHR